MWDFISEAYLETWRRIVITLKLDEHYDTPSQTGHGGINRDHQMELRTREQIKARARWTSD